MINKYINWYMYMCKSLQSCLILCDPVDCSLPGFSVHGILQARILEWVVMPSSRVSSRSQDWSRVSLCLLQCQVGASPLAPPTKVAQSCLTLCDPMDYAAHGILQARILERVAFPFSRGSSQPRNWTRVSCIAGGFFTNWVIREALITESHS